MKSKFIRDLSIYCILPAIIVSIFSKNYVQFQLCNFGIGIVYTLYTKEKEKRINYTFLSFLFTFTIYFLLKSMMPKSIIIQYNIAFLMCLSIVLLLLEILDKDLSKAILQDLLILLDKNKIRLNKLNQKSKVLNRLKKLSMTFILQLLCCNLLAFYFINIVKIKEMSSIISYELLLSFIFIFVEIYQISFIKISINSIKEDNRRSLKLNKESGKVINLERYR